MSWLHGSWKCCQLYEILFATPALVVKLHVISSNHEIFLVYMWFETFLFIMFSTVNESMFARGVLQSLLQTTVHGHFIQGFRQHEWRSILWMTKWKVAEVSDANELAMHEINFTTHFGTWDWCCDIRSDAFRPPERQESIVLGRESIALTGTWINMIRPPPKIWFLFFFGYVLE